MGNLVSTHINTHTCQRTSLALARRSFLKILTIKESYMVDAEASDCFSEANSIANIPPVEVPHITSKTFSAAQYPTNQKR